ncbi:MAG: TRAP transporter small permease [Defluviitaleaceae bacterium]|nr:TRAP transporter small permease [Defluviitaleaceae bacterium]
MMKQIIIFFDKYLEETLIGICMGYFAIITFVQVIFRFVLGAPLAWTDETARYAFIWMMFLGAAVAVKKGSHIKVDLFELVIKNEKAKAIIRFINHLLFLAFSIIAMVIGINVCMGLLRFPFGSPALEIPMFWVFLSLPVGMAFTSLRIIQLMYRLYIKKDNTKTTDKQEVVA